MSGSGSSNIQVVSETKQEAAELVAKIPSLKDRRTEELVIALVGPVGSGCTTTYKALRNILENDYSYSVHYHKLSEFISESAKLVGETVDENIAADKRIDQLQTVGDKLRRACGSEYLAAKAIEKIAGQRDVNGFEKTADKTTTPKKLRQVHIIDSIKHPEEIRLLKETYGEIFWLIGVFAPQSARERRLSVQQNLDSAALGEIMRRDYREEDDHGQKVRDVFWSCPLKTGQSTLCFVCR